MHARGVAIPTTATRFDLSRCHSILSHCTHPVRWSPLPPEVSTPARESYALFFTTVPVQFAPAPMAPFMNSPLPGGGVTPPSPSLALTSALLQAPQQGRLPRCIEYRSPPPSMQSQQLFIRSHVSELGDAFQHDFDSNCLSGVVGGLFNEPCGTVGVLAIATINSNS